jgi:hypothetical protein
VTDENVTGVRDDAGMVATKRIDSIALDRVLRRQHDVITRAQARAAGVTEKALRYRLGAGGRWQTVLPHVYLAATGTPTDVQRQVAALVYGGDDAVITGPVAAAFHQIRVADCDLINVLVPHRFQARDAGFVRLHRTWRMPERIYRFGPIQYALAPRAVGDTVRCLTSLREVRAVVADAVQKSKCTLQQLVDELNAGPVWGSALFRTALAEVIGGSRSMAESELMKLIEKAGLPVPLFNAEIYDGEEFIARPDAWYPELGIAIEVDSKEWHLGANEHKATLERGNRMQKYLINVLRFTPNDLRYEPARVIAEIREAIARAIGRPPLNLRTVPAIAA